MPRLTSISVFLVLALLSVAAPAAALDGVAAQPKELWEEFPLDSDKSAPPPAEGEQSPPAEPEGNQAAPAEPEPQPEPAPAEPQRAAEQSEDGGLPVALLVLGGLGVIALLVIGRLMLSGRKRRRRAAEEPASPPAAKEQEEPPPAEPERRPQPAPATVKADKPAPVAAAKEQPVTATRDKPAVKSDKPAPIVAQKPPAMKVDKAPTVAAQKPAPAKAQKPVTATEPRPAPVVVEKPAPVADEQPTRIAAEPPAPAKEPKPAPVVAQKPAPPKEHRPAAVAQDKPTRVGTEPTPVAESKPTPVAESKPTPVAEDKPTPVAENKPTPVAENKPTPAKEHKPKQTPAKDLASPPAPPQAQKPKLGAAEPTQPGSKKLPDDVIPFPTRPGRIGRHSSSPASPQRALGYVSAADADAPASDLETQTAEIRSACVRNGFESVEVVRDFESHSGSDLERPGLIYAIERLEAGEASCLVVASLERLTRSAAHLGTLIDRLGESRIRLVVLDIQLDTGNPDGRLAAEALANVGTLERKSLDTRTRKGLQAAREARQSSGRPAVADRPALKDRIADMRSRGMTLQAIADTLNSEGVPTLRGGAEWRPSSVQAAVGYKRPKRGARKSGNGSSGGTSNGGALPGGSG